MSRLNEFLNYMVESAVAKAIRAKKPDDSKEYSESDVKSNMSVLISAIKSLKSKSKSNDLDKASLSDFMADLRQWLKIYNDRFGESDITKSANSLLPSAEPKKNTAPILPKGAIDVKLAAKAGVFSPDVDVIKHMDKKDKEEEEEEEAKTKDKKDKK